MTVGTVGALITLVLIKSCAADIVKVSTGVRSRLTFYNRHCVKCSTHNESVK